MMNAESWKTLPGSNDITRTVLPNGLILLTRSNFNSPSVVISGYLESGSLFDPLEKLGLSHFTAQSLTRGTLQRTFQQIFDALESAGASLGYGANVHTTAFGGMSLAEDLPLLLSTLSETLQQPSFPEEYIERLRAHLLTSLAIRAQDTFDQASLNFEKIIFNDHPYGNPEDGYVETIQAITHQDIIDFHRRYYGPKNMVLIIVGAVSARQALEQVQKYLGDWQNPLQPDPPVLLPVQPLTAPVRKHIALPGKTQTDILLGVLGPRRSSIDFLPASVGNNILGQFGMMGRIGEVVRERAGLAYSASTSLNAWADAGTWEVSAGVNPQNVQKAIDLILAELHRFATELVTPQELEDSKSNLIGRLPLSLESNSGVAGAILRLERFNLGLDYFQHYPQMVAAVTPEEILTATQKYLDAGRLAIVSSGPEEVQSAEGA